MNEIITTNPVIPASIKDSLTWAVKNFDSKSLLIAGGMFCLTAIAFVGFVSLSGSEMSISSSGLTITQPSNTI